MFSDATTFRRKPDLVAADAGGNTVMMDVNSGTYFSLNGVGGHIWAALEEPATLASLVTVVETKFDVPETVDLRQELMGFVTELHENGLLLSEPTA